MAWPWDAQSIVNPCRSTVDTEPAWNSLSPMKYPGGKNRMTPLIMRLIGFTDTYHEVFAGGASVGFTIRRRWPWTACSFNDFDPAVFNFYDVLRRRPMDLHKKVRRVWRDLSSPEDMVEFYHAIRPILRSDRLNELDAAAAYFLCNRIGYCGVTVGVAGTTGDINMRLNDRLIDTLPFWSSVLSDIEITNLDYRLALYRVPCGAAAFIDPPYETYESGPFLDIYWSEPWRRAEMLDLADHLLTADRRGVRWVTTLMLSPATEPVFLNKLITSSNSIRFGKLPVRHCLVDRHAEELILWNFTAE